MKNAHRIVRGLWMGAYPPEGRWLANHNFTMLVLVAEEHVPRAILFRGIDVRLFPLDDGPIDLAWTNPLHAALRKIGATIRREVERGGKVMVACNEGRNRSGLVVAFALRELGHDPSTVVEFIRRRRSVPNVLMNHWFEEAIRTWGVYG